MELTAVFTPAEEGGYVAFNPEMGTTTEGESSRRVQFPRIQFTFLGYCFRPRMAKNRHGEIFTSFLPAVSPQALRRMRDRIRQIDLRRQTYLPLEGTNRRISSNGTSAMNLTPL